MTRAEPEYFRRDIQGLRGIAVLLVVIYHTGIALPGGYIGVDVFFVISGYVITQLLNRESQTGIAPSLTKFYSRRVKRILPAVAIAIIGTLFLSIFALSPFGEQKQVAETARASSLFAANFYFYLQDSYWALAENPLRHLWSLAVEEQFYLVFPLLVLLLHKFKLKLDSLLCKFLFLTIAIGSFALSHYLTLGNQLLPKPELFAFFGTPWRMWEFLAGALIALIKPPVRLKSQPLVLVSSAIGLFVIIWAAITFDSFTPFPGGAALAPVVGTSVLIYFGNQKTLLNKVFSSKALVFFGSISFSWYLWHWPLIVFAHRIFPASEVTAPILAAALSIPLAVLSLHKIENPIRYNKQIHGKKVVQLGGACILLPLIFSIGTQALGNTRLGLTEIQGEGIDRLSYADKRKCRIDLAITEKTTNCLDQSFGAEAKTLMLVGDSAAGSISDSIARVAKLSAFNFAVYYANSCPVSARPFEYRENCAMNFDEIAKKISEVGPEILVIANMSDLYVSSAGLGKTIVDFDGKPATSTEEALEFWIENWKLLIKKDLISQRTLIIQQPPLSIMREPVLLQRFIDEEISLDNSDTRNMIVEAESKLFQNFKNIAVFDPATVLCDEKNCRQTLNGDALYYDSRHLTVKGSLLMVNGIKKALEPLLNED